MTNSFADTFFLITFTTREQREIVSHGINTRIGKQIDCISLAITKQTLSLLMIYYGMVNSKLRN